MKSTGMVSSINQFVGQPSWFFYIFRYSVWNFRTRKKIPCYNTLLESILNTAGTVFNLRPSVRRSFVNSLHFNKFFQALG
jgi:hypothetical protein